MLSGKEALQCKDRSCCQFEFEGFQINSGLRLDMVVDDCLVVEVKAVEVMLAVHKAQLLTYLRLSGHRLGLLINFNVPLIRNGITRIAS
jgi:GxxExxY protein